LTDQKTHEMPDVVAISQVCSQCFLLYKETFGHILAEYRYAMVVFEL